MSYYPEKPTEVRIKQDSWGLGDSVKVKLTGGRAWAAAVSLFLISGLCFDVAVSLDQANNLKRKELDIRKEQLDLARRQFQLDSIAAKQNEKNR